MWDQQYRAEHGKLTRQTALRTAKIPPFWLVLTAGLIHWLHTAVLPEKRAERMPPANERASSSHGSVFIS